jgi:hypothetical protein
MDIAKYIDKFPHSVPKGKGKSSRRIIDESPYSTINS